MAIMTSQHPEGVVFEKKIQPVPSSDEMALDLEINGTSNRNETSLDATSTENDGSSSKHVDPSPLNEFTPSTPDVNGATNDSAFASNATIESNSIEQPSLESQETDFSSSVVASPQLPEAITTTTTEAQQPSAEAQLPETSPLLASADAAIEAAVDDSAPSSTLPPVVETKQSDLRDSTPPPAPAPAVNTQQDEQRLNLGLNDSADPLPSEQAPQGADTVEAEVAGISLEPSNSVLLPSHDETLQQPTADPDLDLTVPSEPEQDNSIHATMDVNHDTSLDVSVNINDTEMADAPLAPLSTKIPREREDDDESEPSAKRPKTEDDSLMEAMDSTDVAPVQNGESADSSPEGSPISQYEAKEIIKIIKNVTRTQDGKNFRLPVRELWPAVVEPYESKITNQIDLGTIEKKLRENTYPNLDAFKTDIQLLEDNAITFNGPEHTVSRSAANVHTSILNKISNIPPEPAAVPKKEKKPKRSTPVGDGAARAPPARRQSRGAGTSSADPPPTQTFALNPQTSTPLIRRDSTKVDGGRPKREIHPPKNKDLVYSVRPKSKKFDTELRWCTEVLNELKKPKYSAFASAFYNPVDPVALGIPTYFNIIKFPMDLSTVQGKLDNGEYANSKEFEKDMALIFSNCYKFNPAPHVVNQWGKQLEEVYKAQLSNKTQWIASRAPAAASHSPTPDSDEEESEEEPEVPVTNNTNTVATKRLVEEQAKLIELMNDKDTDPSIVQMQKDMVNIVQKRVNEEVAAAATAAAAAVKKSKKPKAPKALKKAAPAKKAATVPKKSGGNRQSQKYLGTLEKEVISIGIASLPEEFTAKILEMIKVDTTVDVGDDGSVELDIDAVGVPTLWKIYNMVMQHAPEVEPELRRQMQERDTPRAPAKPAPKKKNKPMSKVEQERKIEQLKSSVQDFERHGSGSQEPLPTVENHDDSSGDEDSDSEEE